MSGKATAVVFPGQGCQRAGMAHDFHDAYPESRAVFEQASDAVGFDVARLCFEDDPRLAQTEYQQPAILTAELAMLAALRAHFGFAPQWFAGHSLGEYAALAAAGVMDAGAAAALVRERGRLMQAAVPVGEGGMTALLKPELDVERLRALMEESDGIEVDVANLNSPDQVVLAGSVVALARAAQRLKEDAGFARARQIPLKVSAPFHSRMMRPAAEALRPMLERCSSAWTPANSSRVVSNVTGDFHGGDRAALVDVLAKQVASPVRWLDCMRALARCGATVYEVGPARTLAGFFKGIGVPVESVTDTATASRVLSA